MGKSRLSKSQIKAAKKQAKEKREKELLALENTDKKAFEEKQKQMKVKKDKMGFTKEDRLAISEKKIEINNPKPKVTWNFKEGDLVYLPNGEVGIIVQNNAKDLELVNNHYNMKESLSRSYLGQVFVVTSSGNNWYYPKTLKSVRN
jgi:hypothetical protein